MEPAYVCLEDVTSLHRRAVLTRAEHHVGERVALAPSVHGGMGRLRIVTRLGNFSPMLRQQVRQPPSLSLGGAEVELPMVLVFEHAGFVLVGAQQDYSRLRIAQAGGPTAYVV